MSNQLASPASTLSSRWLITCLENAQPYSGGRLLDNGCGTKPYKGLFKAIDHFGIDWPNSFHKLKTDVFSDAQAIPFASRVFDTVLCTEVLEHLPHPAKAVSEMARVLRPGGYLILSVPFVHILHEVPHDYFRFTYFGIQSLIADANLDLIQCWPRGGIVTVMMDLLGRFMISFIQGISRKVPKAMHKYVLFVLMTVIIVWPQKIFAAISIGMAKKSQQWRFLKMFDTSSKLTLGYVCVARKLEKIH